MSNLTKRIEETLFPLTEATDLKDWALWDLGYERADSYWGAFALLPPNTSVEEGDELWRFDIEDLGGYLLGVYWRGGEDSAYDEESGEGDDSVTCDSYRLCSVQDMDPSNWGTEHNLPMDRVKAVIAAIQTGDQSVSRDYFERIDE
jgi:hypothetical protein